MVDEDWKLVIKILVDLKREGWTELIPNIQNVC